MDFTLSLFIGSFILLLVIILNFTKGKKLSKNPPPGAQGLPILGCLTLIKPTLFLYLKELGKQYGPVYTIKLGERHVLILNSYEALKEALVNQAHVFSGRMKDEQFNRLVRNQGILFTDGEPWKHQRRNALRTLKDFGFGRDGSKEIVQIEIEDLFKIINSKIGTPMDTQKLFSYCTANIINAICVNEKPAHVSREFQKVLRSFDEIVKTNPTNQIPTFFPSLMKFPFMFRLLELFANRLPHFKCAFQYITEQIKDHKDKFDETQEPKDLIDAMLLQEKDAKANEIDYSEELYHLRIVRTIFELFLAGNDTTATSLTWMFFLLALHPQVLKRMQEEIDLVCDKSSPVRIEHKNSLPYCCAVIDEVSRFSSVVPYALVHRTTIDTKLMGFDIPANTMVIPHLYGVHHDPKYWEKPDEFYPEHFLTTDGKRYNPREQLAQFSLGPRTCMGELLANIEMFLISVSVAREYNVSLCGNESKDMINKIILGSPGGIHRAGVHELKFTRR